MYLTYDEYKAKGGELDETAFNTFAYEAEMRIKAETHNRITDPSEAVKMCMVRLIDIYQKADVTTSAKHSFSHDGLSGSIEPPAIADCSAKIDDIIYTYLIHEESENGVPLLYMGVSEND